MSEHNMGGFLLMFRFAAVQLIGRYGVCQILGCIDSDFLLHVRHINTYDNIVLSLL